MTVPIRVIINGASGKMGQEAVRAIEHENDLVLVGQLGRDDNLAAALKSASVDVVVDLTTAEAVYSNTKTIIEHDVRPVIGTSGLSNNQLIDLKKMCATKKLGGIVAPNFSLGAILTMLFAKQAAQYFPNCEIIEMHHAQKKDSPSGTAIKTAEYMQANNVTALESLETIKGSRGARHHTVPIHSIRLPGLVAHQEVIFGGHHETLTLRHDVFNRSAYMPGLILSVRKVMALKQLIYGLENIL